MAKTKQLTHLPLKGICRTHQHYHLQCFASKVFAILNFEMFKVEICAFCTSRIQHFQFVKYRYNYVHTNYICGFGDKLVLERSIFRVSLHCDETVAAYLTTAVLLHEQFSILFSNSI